MTYQVGYLWDIIKNIEAVKLPALNNAVRLIDKKIMELQQNPLDQEVKDKVDKIYSDHYEGDHTIVKQIEEQMNGMKSEVETISDQFKTVIQNQDFLTNYSNFNEMKETIDRVDKNIAMIGDASKLNALLDTYDSLIARLEVIGDLELKQIEGFGKESEDVSLSSYLSSLEEVLHTVSTILLGTTELKSLSEYVKASFNDRLQELETKTSNLITIDNMESFVKSEIAAELPTSQTNYDTTVIIPRENALEEKINGKTDVATVESMIEENSTTLTETIGNQTDTKINAALSSYSTSEAIGNQIDTKVNSALSSYSTTEAMQAHVDTEIKNNNNAKDVEIARDYYNKHQIDITLNDYYTKSQVDAAIQSGVGGIDLKNYYTKSEVDTEIGNVSSLVDIINDSYLDRTQGEEDTLGVRSIVLGTYIEQDGAPAQYIPGLYDVVHSYKVTSGSEETLKHGLMDYVLLGYKNEGEETTSDGLVQQLLEIQRHELATPIERLRTNYPMPSPPTRVTDTLDWIFDYIVTIDNDVINTQKDVVEIKERLDQMESSNGTLVAAINHANTNQINGLVGKDFPYKQSFAINPTTGAEVTLTRSEQFTDGSINFQHVYIHSSEVDTLSLAVTETSSTIDLSKLDLKTIHIGGITTKEIKLILKEKTEGRINVIIDCSSEMKKISCVADTNDTALTTPITYVLQAYVTDFNGSTVEEYKTQISTNYLSVVADKDVVYVVQMPFA